MRDSLRGGWVLPVAAAVAVGLCAASARGGGYTEWDAGTGNWWTASNWTNGVPNIPDDVAGYVTNGGTVQISYGDANAPDFTVSVGHVEHTGGTLTSTVSLGNVDNATPTYRLAGTGVLHGATFVGSGDGMTATFTQDGGRLEGGAIVGCQGASCLGRFFLNDGLIEGTLVVVGSYAEGEFYHDGGVVDLGATGQVSVGDYAPSTGTYEMTGSGAELLASVYRIGHDGTGTFIQHDGTSEVEVIHLGERTGSFGRLELHGGSTNVSLWMYVGEWGEGELEVTGGSHGVTGTVYVGGRSGGRGACLFDGGTFEAGELWVGSEGHGQAVQTSGTVAVGGLSLGGYSGSSGTYDLAGGLLTCESAFVGGGDEGAFFQTGGEHTVTGELYLDGDFASPGRYELDGPATLEASTEFIGSWGAGEFLHGDGEHVVAGQLVLGWDYGSEGTYELTGEGTLEADSILVGDWGLGRIVQSGGTIDVAGHVALSGQWFGEWQIGGEGTLDLSGGLFRAGDESVGLAGPGEVCHTGGQHVVAGTLALGVDANAHGTYELGGTGELEADSILVGLAGTATLNQNDGFLTAREVLVGVESTACGTLRIADGLFETEDLCVGLDGNATLDLADGLAEIRVYGLLHFGPGAAVSAAGDATLLISGSLVTIETSDANALAGLADAHLLFEDTDGPCLLEVAGRPDLGFEDNFALGTLQVGGEAGSAGVVLVDDVDNGRRADARGECLFVGELIVEDGSELDLAGRWLYIDGNEMEAVSFYLAEAMIVDSTAESLRAWYDADMDWTVIPEPTTAALLTAALALAAASRRRRRRR